MTHAPEDAPASAATDASGDGTAPELDPMLVLERTREAELLRFTTAGSVDDGKSTLIGRLLSDTKGIYEDQLDAAEKASAARGNQELTLAYLMDGLKAEREQGITIDVAYRYFSTPRRRFIIADTPGHEQYTRNMATGASTADLAIILVDARKGVSLQSKRHAFIASLLGIPHVVVAINKMDLVDFDEAVFERVREEFEGFCARLGIMDLRFIPISALHGDNVVERGDRMPWYGDSTLLHHLETVYVAGGRNLIDFRFPVQSVIRPDQDFRGFAGQVVSGVVRLGDEVAVLPSGRTSRVARIHAMGEELDYACPPLSVCLCLEDELDVSRGDMIVHLKNRPRLERQIEAMVVWMSETPLALDKPYWVKHTTRWTKGVVRALEYRIDPKDLHRGPAESLGLNDIGRIGLDLYQPLACDEYKRNRATGSFILVDPDTNDTVAAGMVIERSRHRARIAVDAAPEPVSKNVTRHRGEVVEADRRRVLKQKGACLWLTGLSGSGKSTIAFALEKRLMDRGQPCFVLDGDNVRHGLNRDLGFSPTDRQENIRRVGEVAALFADAGLIVITAFISPYKADRERARAAVGEARFLEIHLDVPLATCEGRDPKGLYAKARAGEILEFTGVSAPYEAPENPALHLPAAELSPGECAARLEQLLMDQGVLPSFG